MDQWRAAIGCYAHPGPRRERLVRLTDTDSADDSAEEKNSFLSMFFLMSVRDYKMRPCDPDYPTQGSSSKRFIPCKLSQLIVFTLIIMSVFVPVGEFLHGCAIIIIKLLKL